MYVYLETDLSSNRYPLIISIHLASKRFSFAITLFCPRQHATFPREHIYPYVRTYNICTYSTVVVVGHLECGQPRPPPPPVREDQHTK